MHISVSAWSAFECGARYLTEKGEEVSGESAKNRMEGTFLHRVASVCNYVRMKGKEVTRDGSLDAIRVISSLPEFTALKNNPYFLAQAEDSTVWFNERLFGSSVIAVEQAWTMEIAGQTWKGVFDCVRINDEGVMVLDEYKKGFIPDRDEAKRSIQLAIYALVLMKQHECEKVIVNLMSIGNKFNINVEFNRDEVDAIERYLTDASERLAIAMQELADGKAVLGEGFWDERRNPFCLQCSRRMKCKTFMQFTYGVNTEEELEEALQKFGGAIGSFYNLKQNAGMVERVWNRHKDALKAEAIESGGSFSRDGYTVTVKTETKFYSAKPERKVDMQMFKMVKEISECETKGKKNTTGGDKNSLQGGSEVSLSGVAKPVGKSLTKSARKKAGGNSKITG